MSTALVLTTPHLLPLANGSAGPAANDRETRPAFLYGDSTPFPYDCDYVDLIDAGVTCAVTLMRAQHALGRAIGRVHEVEQRRVSERGALLAMGAAIRRAVQDEGQGDGRVAHTATRLLASTTATIESEISSCDADAKTELAKANGAREEAQGAAFTALEAFARTHDLPGTELSLRLFARESGYDAQAIVATPFALEAAFDVVVPTGHAWSQLRRIGDVDGPLDVRVPRDTGWFSERMELVRVKLGKMTVRRIVYSPARCLLSLGKGPKGGVEHEIAFDPRVGERRAAYRERRDGGATEPFELNADDALRFHRLWGILIASIRDLGVRRRAMTQAYFRGKPFVTQDPEQVARALIESLAPNAREIQRRSGAIGELVLRRDAGQRRRDEVYITTAELLERVQTLPPQLRGAFDPLRLEAVRSPRAPAPSLPAYEEIGDADILLQ